MHWTAIILCLSASSVISGELYSTGFENFSTGPDRIAGAPASGTSPAIPATDAWTGSHAGQDRSGIFDEATHAVPGIGNAAYLGGKTTPITTGGNALFVRKTFNYQPVSDGNEVVTLRVLTGLKDSSGLPRDNFEFLIYNNNSLGGGSTGAFPLAGIQFDNSQINPQTLKPYQAIYRYNYDSSSQSMRYFSTGLNFVYDTLEQLEIRINFRTNLWSANLDSVPLFSDIPFYNGPYARNLGSVLVLCRVSTPVTPGGNYLVFDDLSINADTLDPVTPPEIAFDAGTGVRLTWFQEAGYGYEIRYVDPTGIWKPALGGGTPTASSTGFTGSLTDSTAIGIARRFYQLIRTAP